MARRFRLVLGGRFTLWPLLSAACLFVFLYLGRSPAVAAEGITWVADFDVAVKQARAQQKLLIVVDFAEDFTRPTERTRSQHAYTGATLADKRCRELLDTWFVLTSRSVGYPPTISATVPVKGEPKVTGGEHAITYFVTADGRVLHFLSGFVSADTFVKEAGWLLESYADIQRFPAAEQPQAARENHLARIPSDNALGLFSALQRAPPEIDVAQILAAARKQREQVLLARLGNNFLGAEGAKLLAAMAAHGEVEADQAHVVLSEIPLIRLADLQRPAWTVLTGQRFWQTTARRAELCRWAKQNLAASQPMLLVVAPLQPVPAPAKPAVDKVPWPPKSSTVAKLLPQFEVQEITLDELAALIADAGLRYITTTVTKPPRFVVVGPGGKRQDVTTEEDGYTKLGRVLAAAVEPRGVVPDVKGTEK